VSNLARAGHDPVLWNRSADRAEALAAEIGATCAETPCAVAERCDIVFTMLADDAPSHAVHFGPDGLFAGGAGADVRRDGHHGHCQKNQV